MLDQRCRGDSEPQPTQADTSVPDALPRAPWPRSFLALVMACVLTPGGPCGALAGPFGPPRKAPNSLARSRDSPNYRAYAVPVEVNRHPIFPNLKSHLGLRP
jgi:hypothetical protein